MPFIEYARYSLSFSVKGVVLVNPISLRARRGKRGCGEGESAHILASSISYRFEGERV